MSSRAYLRAGALVAIATLATACTSSSTHASTSSPVPVASSAAALPSASSAGTSSSGARSSAAPTLSAPVLSSPAVSGGAIPDAAHTISVRLTRSHQIGKGDVGAIDFDQLTVLGLPAAVSAALQAPATEALANYTKDVSSQEPCTGPACGSGSFQATFTTSRADFVVVSGSWTISTYYPGAAHPTTQITAVTVDSTDGASIAPSQLFVGSSLKALAAATSVATKAKLKAIGCTDEFSDGIAPKTANYVGTSIGQDGLLIGLSQGQVAAEACGTIDLAVPWSAVYTQLSDLGAELATQPVPAGPVVDTGAPAASSANAARCAALSLDVTLGNAKQVVNAQYQVPIVFTNVSAHPCFLLGFPGTDFGAAGTLAVSLVRTPAKPARIELDPGHQAHAVLTYLSGPDPTCDAGGPWIPSTLTITPPDDTTSVQIPWPAGSVDDCQQGATHPGSYVGPVTGAGT